MEDEKTAVSGEKQGAKRRVGIRHLAAGLLVLVVFCLAQGYGYFKVDPVMKRYKASAETLGKRV